MIVLIGGGSRSGKSRYALEYAKRRGPCRVYIATAECLDSEMSARAAAHRSERGTAFTTLEEPIELARTIRFIDHAADVIVIDCLTLWVSNLLLGGRDIPVMLSDALAAAAGHPACIVMVTNEVGCGIVPENELARRFRDAAGSLNQQVAAAAQEVYWMAFGCPLRVK